MRALFEVGRASLFVHPGWNSGAEVDGVPVTGLQPPGTVISAFADCRRWFAAHCTEISDPAAVKPAETAPETPAFLDKIVKKGRAK